MQARSGITTFFALTTIILSIITGFFAYRNQTLAGQIRESTKPTPTPTATASPSASPSASPEANIANPASVFCIARGGKVIIKTASDSSQSGTCVIKGKEYDEWEYFRKYSSPLPSPTE